MLSVVAFLRPTKLKLLFLSEWAAYLLFMAARGGPRSAHWLLVAAYPIALYYLVGCVLVALSRRVRPMTGDWTPLAWGVGLVLADQGAKALVAANLPFRASVPIFAGWLDLVHVRNVHGSWLASLYGVHVPVSLQWALTVFLALLAVVSRRYYITTHRRSFWADVAFLGCFAAFVSSLADLALHGYVLDFIGLPGHFAADLKDVWLGIGGMAVFAEGLDNPAFARPWPGWREELKQSGRLIGDISRFAARDLSGLWRARTTRHGRS